MMQKFSDFVVKKRWIFIALFVVLVVVSTVMLFQNKVIYDLTVFAPKDSNTQKSLEVLKAEFDDKGSAYVMVKDVSLEEAEAIAAKLTKIDGVAGAVLDTANNYKNNCALINIVLEDYDSTSGANKAISDIIEFMSDKEAYLSGQSAMSYYTRLETVESILKIGVVIAIAIIVMLFFTSKTYFEFVIMIIVFAVSILINMGTNFIFNGISYVSNLVALVLQLALSIDYSVILLHRFMEEYEISDAKTAAATSLRKGITEILSSSLTTIAGLLALVFMTLPIGVEMGLSLAKGIVASLMTVIFLMPPLLTIFAKPLSKSKHKNFVPNITKASRVILKARKIIMPAFLILVIVAATGQFYNSYSYNINGAARIVNSNNEIAEEFGIQNSLVVIVPKGDYQKEKELTDYVLSKEVVNGVNGIASIQIIDGLYLTDKVNIAELVEFGKDLGLTESVAKLIFDMYIQEKDPDTQIPIEEYRIAAIDLLEFAYGMFEDMDLDMEDEAGQLGMLVEARKSFESQNYNRMIFNINSEVESEESLALIAELEKELGQFYSEFYLAGESVACYDMSVKFPSDNLKVTLFTTIFVLIILLFTFKNLLFPIILMVAIQGGIWINFAVPFISGSPVSFIGYLLISGIQMGATIDYAIVLASRYNSTKLLYEDKVEAMAISENAVFPTIITSGTILTVSGFAMGILGAGIVAQMGMLLGIGALSSVLIVLFVVPSMLLVLDKISEKANFHYLANKIRQKTKKS